MKRLFVTILLLFDMACPAFSQDKPKIYNPEASARQDIDAAIARAAKEHKRMFIQVGGNRCIWCIRFHQLIDCVDTLRRLMEDNYIVAHLNYSPENYNWPVLETLGKPQQHGFPVFVILDAHDNRIHTRSSSELEEGGNWHSRQKVSVFLRKWAAGRDATSGNNKR